MLQRARKTIPVIDRWLINMKTAPRTLKGLALLSILILTNEAYSGSIGMFFLFGALILFASIYSAQPKIRFGKEVRYIALWAVSLVYLIEAVLTTDVKIRIYADTEAIVRKEVVNYQVFLDRLEGKKSTYRPSKAEPQDPELYPLSNISNSNVIQCKRMNYFVYFQTDSFGFRNPNNNARRKNNSIALLGDEIASGFCEHEEDTLAGILRVKYPDLVNYGVKDSGPLANYAKYREFVTYNKPKLVLWIHNESNDFLDLRFELKHQLLRRYRKYGFTQHLRDRVFEADTVMNKTVARSLSQINNKRSKSPELRIFWNLRRMLRLHYFRESIFRELRNLPSQPYYKYRRSNKKLLEVYSKMLGIIKNDLKKHDGKIAFIYVPDPKRFTGNAYKQTKMETLQMVRGLGINTLDFTNNLNSTQSPSDFYGPDSLALSGYKRLAEFIESNLLSID